MSRPYKCPTITIRTMRPGILAVVLSLLCTAAVPAAQNPPPIQTGAISGTVVDGSTGALLPDALVTLIPQTGTKLPTSYPLRQTADSKGRFVFMDLPEGVYQISGEKFGFLDGGFGRDTAPTDPLRDIKVGNGSWMRSARVNLWRPAVISGSVVDESGEPVVGVFVRALARVRIAGRDELAAGPLAMTDDRGRYRLSGLLPGRYVVQVPSVQMAVAAGTRIPNARSNMPEGAIDLDDSVRLMIGPYPLPPPSAAGRAMTYGVAFHPNVTAAAQALAVDVAFGDDRSGIDVALSPVPSVRVSGVVEGPPEALAGLTLRLLPAGMENLGLGAEAATALVAANGTFTFVNVPAGSYTLDAPLTFNGFTVRSGATRSGGSVGFGSASLPAPPNPAVGGSSSMSQETMAAPGVSLSMNDYRGASGAAVPKFTGRVPVMVGVSDVTGVTVRLRGPVSVKGNLRIDADPSKPAEATPPRFFPFLDPASGQPGLGQPRMNSSVTPNQDFEIAGAQPAAYYLRVQGAIGWQVKSVQAQGRDYTLTPFDLAEGDPGAVVVTMTNAIPTLFGTARNSDGTVPDAGLIVVFPVQPGLRVNTGLWSSRITAIPLAADGTFRLTSLPAGDYFVAAIDRAKARTWRDPDVLAQIERQAARVALAWGQNVGQDVTMAVIR